MKTAAVHIAFILLVAGIGIFIGFDNLPGEWYQTLNKPGFTPPNWLFGPAWTILYILIGIAGARTWLRGPYGTGMMIWFGQMLFNFLWSPFFFGLQVPATALAIIIILFLLIIAFIANRCRRDRISAWLFVPYALWVGFATILNASIVALN